MKLMTPEEWWEEVIFGRWAYICDTIIEDKDEDVKYLVRQYRLERKLAEVMFAENEKLRRRIEELEPGPDAFDRLFEEV